jgi:hypothetical protein
MLRNRSKTIKIGNYRLESFYCAGQWWCLAETRVSNIPADVKYNAWVALFLWHDDDCTSRDETIKASLRIIQRGLIGMGSAKELALRRATNP